MGFTTSCTRDCTDTCSLIIEKDENGGLKVRGNPDHPITAGFTCAKIRNFSQRLASPDRITEPLLKTEGGWQAIGWDRALDLVAGKIQALRAEPEKMLHLFSGGDHGLVSRAMAGFFGALGTSTWTGALCDETGAQAFLADFGRLEQNDISDLSNAKQIVNWGKDPVRSSIHTAWFIKKAKKQGAEVITISPGGDSTAEFSDHSIRINPGTDRFLAAAVAKELIGRGEISQKAIERTANWTAYKDILANWSLEDLLDWTGVSTADLSRLVNIYAGAGAVASLIGWGLQRYAQGGENVRFINALAMISGNIHLSGGGTHFGLSSARSYNLKWVTDQVKPNRREMIIGLLPEELAQADPPIELAWVNCGNPINQIPNSWAVAREFEKIPFKVVVEAFMTDTAARADLILPCALMWEREDLASSSIHNYLNHAAQVLPPPGLAKTDHWIITELGKRLDPQIPVPGYEECLRLALDSEHLNTSLEEIREQGFARTNWPVLAFENLEFGHSDGLYHFPENLTEPPAPPQDYPLRLLSFVRKGAIHSQILPDEHPELPTVWLGQDCPAWQGRQPGDTVFLASPLARMKVHLEISPDLHPGSVIYRRGDWLSKGGGQNQLIKGRLTDMGNGAAYYEQFVRIEDE